MTKRTGIITILAASLALAGMGTAASIFSGTSPGEARAALDIAEDVYGHNVAAPDAMVNQNARQAGFPQGIPLYTDTHQVAQLLAREIAREQDEKGTFTKEVTIYHADRIGDYGPQDGAIAVHANPQHTWMGVRASNGEKFQLLVTATSAERIDSKGYKDRLAAEFKEQAEDDEGAVKVI